MMKRLQGLDPDRVGLIAMIVAMAAAAALILWLERGTTYMSDEFGWINFAGRESPLEMFRPLNQHLTVLVLWLTQISMWLWGNALLPFKLLELAGVLACGALVYAFARPRMGPLAALAPAMVPMFLGTATVILLQPLIGFQVLYSIAFGIGALVALDRGTRGGDVAACVLLVLSLASFSIGFAFLAGAAVAVLLMPERTRRAYVFMVPTVLYGIWRIWANQHDKGAGPELHNLPAVPLYVIDSIPNVIASLFGLSVQVGAPGSVLFLQGFSFSLASAAFVYAAIEVVAIVVVARWLGRRRPIPVMLWATLAVLLALWTIQGLVLVEGRTPAETRYIYPGAVALALVAAAALERVRLSRFAVAAILAVTAVGIVGNLPRWNDGRNLIEYLAPRNLAYTGVMDLAGKNAARKYIPAYEAPGVSPAGALSITVNVYQEISDRYGPIGYTPAEIAAQPEEIRHGSDVVAVGMLGLGPTPTRSLPRAGCETTVDDERGAELPPHGALLRSGETTLLFLRRFADRGGVEIGRLEAGEPALLRIPPDRAPQPWVLEAPGSGRLTICAAGPERR